MATLDIDSLPQLDVSLTASYHLHSVQRIVAALRPIYDLDELTTVRLDLRELTFISPACLAFMAAVMRRGRENHTISDDSSIVHPRSVQVKTYLFRMDFLQVLFEHEPVEPADWVERREVKGLKECEHFQSQSGGLAVAMSLADTAAESIGADSAAISASLKMCLSELTENVYYHAAAPHGGFAAAQTFKASHEVEIAIVDLGIGIRGSLAKNRDYDDVSGSDLEAIAAAMRPLVTATPWRNSGYGLAFTRYLLEGNDGRVVVWSGEGLVTIGANYKERRVDPFPGTMVVLRLHTDRPFDHVRAYEKLTAAIVEIEGESDDDMRALGRNEPS